jgi:hypothetical protein
MRCPILLSFWYYISRTHPYCHRRGEAGYACLCGKTSLPKEANAMRTANTCLIWATVLSSVFSPALEFDWTLLCSR